MEKKKIYEQCNHEWEVIEKYKRFISRVGNSIMGGTDHYDIVIIQQCKKCGKINKV